MAFNQRIGHRWSRWVSQLQAFNTTLCRRTRRGWGMYHVTIRRPTGGAERERESRYLRHGPVQAATANSLISGDPLVCG
jgi:hypothetical protein